MAISEDIKEVLEEIGTSLTIHYSNGDTVTGLYVDPEGYPEQSTLFTRMFLKVGSLPADTPVVNGDIVEFGSTFHIVTNLVPTAFENDVVEKIAMFYRCNVVVDLFSHSDSPAYDGNYDKVAEWTQVGTSVPVCMVEKQLTPLPEISEDIYLTGSVTNLVYLPAVYSIKRGDRVVENGRNFLIETVGRYELDGILVCGVTEDHR